MNKIKNCIRVGKTIIPILLLLCLTSCGTNIFKELTDEQLPNDTTALIESGHYEEAIAKADQIIDDANASLEEKQKAYADKGLAILGKNNISLGQIASVAGDFSTASDFLNGGLEQLTRKLPISSIDAQESADMLNAAYALSESGTITPSMGLSEVSSIAPSLNNNAQFRRAFANATVVIKMATYYLDITENGATLNSLAKASDLTLTDVFLYLNQAPRGVYYYSINAYDAAVKSNALTQSQLSSATDAIEAAYNMNELYKAYINGTTFTIKNRNGQNLNIYTSDTFFGLTGNAKETLLKDALKEIYNYYK